MSVGSKFTCLSCRVTFTDADVQREHYKCEWHRYNLKRKVASLAPLPQEDFLKIEALHKPQIDATPPPVVEYYCQCCRKPFTTEKAFDQHNQSKKHLDVSKAAASRPAPVPRPVKVEEVVEPIIVDEPEEEIVEDDGDSDWESASEEELEGDPIDVTSCLFCGIASKSLETNVEHMSRAHSFFIPDAEFLNDLDGLVTYLGEKVGIGLRCLWCCDTGRRFTTVGAVQKHMVDKGHCKMRLETGETLLEYVDFYDYSTSYPDAASADTDEEISSNELRVDDDMQLILPSGAAVGHRSLARYYKQNLRATPLPPRPDNKKAILHNLLSQYRALGWTGSNKKVAMMKACDLSFLAKKHLKVGLTNNKVGQMHFRNQTLQF